MTSKLIVNSIRHTGASADAITMDASGNVTFPANATCSGTATGFGGGKVLQYKYVTTGTTYATTSGTYANMSAFDLTVTPTSASSILVIQLNIRAACWHTSSNGGNYMFALSDDNGSSYLTQASFYPYRYDSGGLYMEGSDTQIISVSAANTNARTYKVYHKAGAVSNAKVNQNNTDESSLQVWEVST